MFVEESGYKLISNEYKNSKEKLAMECPNGHECNIRFNDFNSSNVRCSKCRMLERSFTIDYIKRYIKQEEYTLISDLYVSSKEKLELECPNGHRYKVTFNNFKSANKRCQKCYFQNSKLSYEYVRSYIEKEGYILNSKEYVGSFGHLHVTCPNEHSYYTTWSNFYNNNTRCRQCYVNSFVGENTPNWRGGIYPNNKKQRHISKYIKWRNDVFLRDKYTCQCCYKIGGKLNAHHIENFSSNEELRFDINNGITLCFNCHSQSVKGSFHNIYGTTNNNKIQLIEYINDYKKRKEV